MSMPSSSEAVATSARSSPRFRRASACQARLLRHAAVVRGDVLRAEPLGQVARDALGLAAGVDEHQRGAMLAHELREAIVDLRPDLPGHHRFQRRGRDLELQIALAHVPGIDDGAVGAAVGAQVARADQEARHLLDGLLRGRQADARQLPAGERFEPLERERQVHAALAADHGVDLVHDHGARGREHPPAGLRAHEDVERLGRRDHDVRRALARSACARAAACRRCARRCGSRSPAGRARASSARMPASGASRLRWMSLESALSGETYTTRVSSGRPAPSCACAHQLIDRGQKGGQRLAGAGGGGDQYVLRARRSPARPRAAPRSARRRCGRTRPLRPDGRRRAWRN